MLTYEILTREDGAVVVRYGRQPVLSDEEHAAVKEAVSGHLAAGSRRFFFDWRMLRFLSSDGLGFLISLAEMIRAGGGEPTLLMTRMPRLERVAAITNLAAAVDIDWAPFEG